VPSVNKAATPRLAIDPFIVALFTVILLAYFWPELGVEESPVPLGAIASYGVSVIFFFSGLGNWRLHVVVQLSTFLLFPMLALICNYLFANEQSAELWLGVFYLAALPSTVSSSVVMVSIAGGNLPAAIFNASISSLLGVFITPLWMGFFMQTTNGTFDFWPVIGKLAGQVLLPVVLGILLHARFGSFAEKYRQPLKLFDQFIILLIVFTSFCESFAQNLFAPFTLLDIFLLSLYLTAFFFLVFGLIYLITRLFNFNLPDQITALFCGSKKSLVHGTVMSKVLFPDANLLGIILLPLMLYHAFQLIAASLLAQSIARRQKIYPKL
jgi:sodium/bile acid cotransporter 7